MFVFCGSAISWCNVTEQPLDVTANGYKHGVTKKALGTAKARWRQHTLVIHCCDIHEKFTTINC